MCANEWDNFSEVDVFSNEQLKNNARSFYGKESQEVFLEEIFELNGRYQKTTTFVLNSLIDYGLLKKVENPKETTYQRTSKLKALCPEILKSNFPVIDRLIEEYDKRHS